MSESRTALVTGGTGMVGTWIARELLARGHRVRALVRSLDKGQRPTAKRATEELGLAFTSLATRLEQTIAWLRDTGELPPRGSRRREAPEGTRS